MVELFTVLGAGVMGVVGGVAYAYSMWIKTHAKESFCFKKAAPVMILGGVLGAVSTFTGQSIGSLESTSFAVLGAAVIENGWKYLVRHTKLKDYLPADK
jgi:D-serine dehydratase